MLPSVWGLRREEQDCAELLWCGIIYVNLTWLSSFLSVGLAAPSAGLCARWAASTCCSSGLQVSIDPPGAVGVCVCAASLL